MTLAELHHLLEGNPYLAVLVSEIRKSCALFEVSSRDLSGAAYVFMSCSVTESGDVIREGITRSLRLDGLTSDHLIGVIVRLADDLRDSVPRVRRAEIGRGGN